MVQCPCPEKDVEAVNVATGINHSATPEQMVLATRLGTLTVLHLQNISW
jgi:hypothetical protein